MRRASLGLSPTVERVREALVDLAILVGTDFNAGIEGIGPKKALALVQRHGRIEDMPGDIRERLGDADAIDEVRRIFLDPGCR